MRLNIEHEKLGFVVAEALRKLELSDAPQKKRWIKALAKATVELEENPFCDWMPNDQHLLIWSKSNAIYEANGTCQCEAYGRGLPCYHRAMARLVQRYLEIW
jgi:hypothetical protein